MTAQNDSSLVEQLLSIGVSDFNLNLLNEIPLTKLIALSLLKDEPKISFRASWALEHILLTNPNLIESLYSQLIANYQQIQHWGSLRSYTKLITFILSHTSKSKVISLKQYEVMLEKTFLIMEEPECPIAVKANCYSVLYHLIEKFPWVKNELRLIIQLNLEKQKSPALNGRGKYILKKIGNS